MEAVPARLSAWPDIRFRDQTSAVWLNLVCLDAPLVSIAWLGLFAEVFHFNFTAGHGVVLFLTAWLIYLADRFADSRSLDVGAPRSLRHAFCLQHRRGWLATILVIGVTDAIAVWTSIDAGTALVGGVVGTLALVHLLLNYALGGAWPPLPLKECAVGALFAMGTLVALFPFPQPVPSSLLISAAFFAGLCTLNCISIAFWERELDEAQGKVSFATRFPEVGRHWVVILAIFAGAAAAVGAVICRDAAPLLGCVSLSSVFLGLIDRARDRINRDQRTALADLALLSPLFVAAFLKV